jgi:hypothetical protein
LDRTVRTARGLLAVLVCLGACVLAGAVGTGRAAAADDGALLRVAHLSPDTPAVDVALALLPDEDDAPLDDPGPDIATGLGYGDVRPYRDLAPGRYALSVRRADSGPRTPPSLSIRIDVPPGGARTVALSGSFADLSLTVLTDDLTAPAPGTARVRVLAAAAGAPTVDLAVPGGPALAEALPFGGAAPWRTVPAGPTTARLGPGTGASSDLPLDLRAGSVTSLLVLDDPRGGLTLRVAVDAAGPVAVPTGPVAAGGGGAAGTASRLPVAALAGAGVLLLAGLRGRRRVVLSLVAVLSAVTVPASAAPAPAQPAPPPVVGAEAARRAAAPLRVQVPSAGVDAPLTGIGLDGAGALAPPDDLATAGWFRQGPAPGEPGPAVLTGHVDSTDGPAIFFRLRDVVAGDPVVVTRADGSTVRFTVTRVARYAKTAFPTAEIYGPTPDAELRLITCGGDFDRSRGSYTDNVVVFAALT